MRLTTNATMPRQIPIGVDEHDRRGNGQPGAHDAVARVVASSEERADAASQPRDRDERRVEDRHAHHEDRHEERDVVGPSKRSFMPR